MVGARQGCQYQGYIYGGLLVADSAAERHFAAKCGPCPQRPRISTPIYVTGVLLAEKSLGLGLHIGYWNSMPATHW